MLVTWKDSNYSRWWSSGQKWLLLHSFCKKMIIKNKEYAKIGRRLIRAEFPDIAENNIRIAWLESDDEKKKVDKTVFADCRTVNKQYEWCCPYDFMITVYAPNVVDFTEEQIEILLRHELMHVGVKQDGNEPQYYVVPHDVEEFDSIIDRFGLDWQRRRM